MFTNILVVVNKLKVEVLKAELATLMSDYYKFIDEKEDKIFPDRVQSEFSDLLNRDDLFEEFVTENGLDEEKTLITKSKPDKEKFRLTFMTEAKTNAEKAGTEFDEDAAERDCEKELTKLVTEY